ncbi:MAG TPA: DedA family protein [Ktedonobacteraceae bacterium]|nr:DedA family protein [Ktedonobacteraceae bacterium]
MSVFLSALLNNLQLYGYPALWVSIFIAAAGVPLPIVFVLLAAGAFAALGDFNIVLLTAISISAAVAGDSLGYLIGRKWGSKGLSWLENSKLGKRFLKPGSVDRSRQYFTRHGGWAVFLSRFLVAALGGIINLLAGSELYPYRKFLLFDIAGELFGALIPLVLGFAFGASWEAVGDIFGTLTLFVLGALVVTYLFILLLRYTRGTQQAGKNEVSVSNNSRRASEMASIIEPPAQSPRSQ